ncbi:MAG: hypothetical protein KGL99_02420 [Burkholderiales bacterium]|nr:hypothetical protein [Burkholderiales bacterium]MDE2625986.1 hypothetical protein [Burkholderiales bacterium]
MKSVRRAGGMPGGAARGATLGVTTVASVTAAVTLAMTAMAASAAPPVAASKPKAAAAPMLWAQAFAVDAAPADVHFRAHYVDGRGTRHVLEAWRAGTGYLHRRTDAAIDLFGVTTAGGETRYRLLDHRRRIAADVSRTNLHRIGVYADAFGLAHVVEPPKEPYRIEAVDAPPGIQAQGCTWRALLRTQSQPRRTLVCWSAAWGLPVAIVDADGTPVEVFRLDAVDRAVDGAAPARPGALPPVPAGYALVDVNDEIDPSAD